ncbi:hypothetical protein Taro_011788, partial [Colocasia esculenta]|nr:hypothetical protein [Colocasia esculenta]
MIFWTSFLGTQICLTLAGLRTFNLMPASTLESSCFPRNHRKTEKRFEGNMPLRVSFTTPEDLNMCLNVCRFMTPEDLNMRLYVYRFMTPEDLNMCLYVCRFMTPEDLNRANGGLVTTCGVSVRASAGGLDHEDKAPTGVDTCGL